MLLSLRQKYFFTKFSILKNNRRIVSHDNRMKHCVCTRSCLISSRHVANRPLVNRRFSSPITAPSSFDPDRFLIAHTCFPVSYPWKCGCDMPWEFLAEQYFHQNKCKLEKYHLYKGMTKIHWKEVSDLTMQQVSIASFLNRWAVK